MVASAYTHKTFIARRGGNITKDGPETADAPWPRWLQGHRGRSLSPTQFDGLGADGFQPLLMLAGEDSP